MEEELAEGVFKSLLRMLSVLVRGLIWLAQEILFDVVFWFVGWPICRSLTLGKYPYESIHYREESSTITQFIVSSVGFLVLLGSGILLSPWE